MVRESGIIDLDGRLRDMCIAYSDGQILVAESLQYDPAIQALQKAIRAQLGVIPDVRCETPAEINARWRKELQAAKAGTEPESAAIEIVHMLFREAASFRTSDIKIIQTDDETQVRLNIAGQEIPSRHKLTLETGEQMIHYLFDGRDGKSGHANLLEGVFQSFSISPGHGIPLPENIAKVRGQAGYHETTDGSGHHMALRLFYSEDGTEMSLADLGFDPWLLAAMKKARDRMKGAVIIGGETGDGKSTTIMQNIRALHAEQEGKISIVTVEDPVEYRIKLDGVIQIAISSAGTAAERTASYRSALMHFVRINPHVGMVSEIRDMEAARQVLQFVESGHQIWSTIHINNATSILFRLIDMGIAPPELARPGSIQLLMKQVLIPLLCEHCADVHAEIPAWRVRKKDGCDFCRRGDSKEANMAWAGYQRLLAVGEFVQPDDDFLRGVQKNDSLSARAHWLKEPSKGGMGGVTVSEKLTSMCNEGLVDPRDCRKKGASPQYCQIKDERESVWAFRYAAACFREQGFSEDVVAATEGAAAEALKRSTRVYPAGAIPDETAMPGFPSAMDRKVHA